jgi:hypothetical protein
LLELPFSATSIAVGHGMMVLSGETEDVAPLVRAYSVTPSLEGVVARALQ